MSRKKIFAAAVGVAAVAAGAGIGWMVSRTGIWVDTEKGAVSIIGGADGPTSIFLAGKLGNGGAESGSRGAERIDADGSGLAEISEQDEEEAGSAAAEQLAKTFAGTWSLAGAKTEEHLKNYGSLQDMWGSGLQYGTGMEIGADGSFSYYIAINFGGSGTVTEQNGALLAEIVPYGEEADGSVESLLILPVMEDEILYLTTPCDGEDMYWERVE